MGEFGPLKVASAAKARHQRKRVEPEQGRLCKCFDRHLPGILRSMRLGMESLLRGQARLGIFETFTFGA